MSARVNITSHGLFKNAFVSLFAISVLMTFAAISLCAQPATITVEVGKPGHAVPPALWGIFFEEINHAGEGGLYGELIQNRDFEATTLAEGWRVDGTNVFTPLGARVTKWFTNDLPGWSMITGRGSEGEIALESANPHSENNPHSLRLTIKSPGERCGIANEGFWGMNVQKDNWYDLNFYARTEQTDSGRGFGLTVSLESVDGKTVSARATIPEVGGAWRKYTLPLHARSSDPKARLVITMDEPGTIWLDCVSLFPRKTFMNRANGMRPDVAAMLAELHPGFLRFPGGCVVEGITVQNRIRWKDSIGDISQRKGGFDVWGYYNTYGLGFHEYLQLAEDLGAQLMYVINCGMSCQARTRQPGEVAAESDLKDYVQESLDALEYATGPTNSEWGAKRAANGHPEPFKLQYVEIGNENRGSNYVAHYRLFYDAIKAKYPGVTTISDTTNDMQGQPMEFVDNHFYRDPNAFFQMANHYNGAARSGPQIYVGEYAVNRDVGRGNLFGALSEAVFMLDMERNSDVVKMASYAPLFENVNKPDWRVNLILLDNFRVVGRSSYQVQKLFSANRPDVVLPTTVEAPTTSVGTNNVRQIYALAGLDRQHGEVILKVVNPTPNNAAVTVQLRGASKIGNQARVITLGNPDANAENTLDAPNVVVPVEGKMKISGAKFSATFTPNSLSIMRVPVTLN